MVIRFLLTTKLLETVENISFAHFSKNHIYSKLSSPTLAFLRLPYFFSS